MYLFISVAPGASYFTYHSFEDVPRKRKGLRDVDVQPHILFSDVDVQPHILLRDVDVQPHILFRDVDVQPHILLRDVDVQPYTYTIT